MRPDDASLLDIAEAARLIVEFQQGFDYNAFARDDKTRAAVLHELLIIGEAAKRLSPEFRDEHGQIDWRSIAGMRDRLIHQYDQVDLEEVWRVVTRDIGLLTEFLKPLLPSLPKEQA